MSQPICEPPEWIRLSGPAALGFSLVYDNNYWLIVPAKMWNVGTQSPLQLEKVGLGLGLGLQKRQKWDIMWQSLPVVSQLMNGWSLIKEKVRDVWLAQKFIPWVIFLTQLKRNLVIKEQRGSSDAAVHQNCHTAGWLHVSDWFLQRVTKQYDVLRRSHQFLTSQGTPVQLQSPFQTLATLRHC